MSKSIDIVGQKFGRLTVLHPAEQHEIKTKQIVWDCLCNCGSTTKVQSYDLRSGNTKSCGCLRRSKREVIHNARHGMWNTPTYTTWEGMKQRCLNPNATRYPAYGAVGIQICDRWLVFDNFLEDMGIRPDGMTLDRINPFGNYEPDNCRWATRKQQQNNQRRHYKTGRDLGL